MYVGISRNAGGVALHHSVPVQGFFPKGGGGYM